MREACLSLCVFERGVVRLCVCVRGVCCVCVWCVHLCVCVCVYMCVVCMSVCARFLRTSDEVHKRAAILRRALSLSIAPWEIEKEIKKKENA